MATQNVAILDTKNELAPQVVPAILDLGFSLICINPKGVYQDRGCIPANINTNECAIDAMYSDDPDHRKMYGIFVKNMLEISIKPLGETASDAARFFNGNGRRIHSIVKTYGILKQPETATPSQEYRILTDTIKARATLERAAIYNEGDDSDPIVNDMRRSATSILEIIQGTPKYLSQFLEVAFDGFACFEEGGFLAHMGDFAVTRISDVRTSKKTVLINMTPLELQNDFTVFNSLVAYNIFASLKLYPDGFRIHAIFEEFNTLRVPNINKELNTARSSGFTCEIYTQSEIGIQNSYGFDVAKEIGVNCSLNHYGACDTLEEAEYICKLIGTVTIRSASANVNEDSFEKIGQAFQDTKVPILSPQDVMSLPPDDQIIKIRGMKPIYARKIKQWEIAGLREILAENPLEGAAPKVPAKMGLIITEDGVTLEYPHARRANPFFPILRKLLTIFRPEYFIWLAAWVIIISAYQFWQHSPDLPAFRYSSEYRGRSSANGYANCDYITLLGQRYTSYVSNCPIITFKYLGV